MRGDPIQVAGQVFPTKAALTTAVREIVGQYQVGETVRQEHFDFLLALFERHHHWRLKSEAGVTAIKVIVHPEWRKNKALALVTPTAAEIDISWTECVSPTPRALDFTRACREAVTGQILKFKRDYFACHGDPAPCQLTGELIGWRECHVDHAPPLFSQIIERFIRAFGLNPARVPLAEYRHGDVRVTFKHDIVRRAFEAFHRENAKLRVVTADANLRLPRKAQETCPT